MKLIPKYILWDPRFTPKHPFYRVSWYPDITMHKMAKDLLGVDLPEEFNEANSPHHLIDEYRGIILCLATWEDFLQIATRKQIAFVQQDIERMLQPGYRPDAMIVIPDGPHGIL